MVKWPPGMGLEKKNFKLFFSISDLRVDRWKKKRCFFFKNDQISKKSADFWSKFKLFRPKSMFFWHFPSFSVQLGNILWNEREKIRNSSQNSSCWPKNGYFRKKNWKSKKMRKMYKNRQIPPKSYRLVIISILAF